MHVEWEGDSRANGAENSGFMAAETVLPRERVEEELRLLKLSLSPQATKRANRRWKLT
jgi:hypothetical protein